MWAACRAYGRIFGEKYLENLNRERERGRESLQIIQILTAMFWIVAQTGNHSLQLASWTAKEDKQVACEIIL